MSFSETTIVQGALYLLGCFSLLTWSVIILKAGEILLNRHRNSRVIKRFTENNSIQFDNEADINLATQVGRVLWVGNQNYIEASLNQSGNNPQHKAWHELIEQAMRQQLLKEKALMDSGLGWLASIGSTAPFVGLFGTVWGIMHALKDISVQGNASLEVVAGPIGEALIATAIGIAVAVPAVIAYNFFLRQNRRLLANLEHIGADYLRNCIKNDLKISKGRE